MATGVLAQAALAATTNTLLYTATKPSAVTVNLVNTGSIAATVRIAIGTIADSANPDTSNYIEYDANIPAKGVIERSGLLLNTSQKIVVYGSTDSIAASVYGIEAII